MVDRPLGPPLARLALLTLAPFLPAQTPEPLKRAGAHFVVEFHAAKLPDALAARLADESLAAAESAWPVLEKLVAVHPDPPLTIHVHVEPAPFRAIEQKLSTYKVPVEAVADLAAREAHVKLWPELSVQALEQVGLPATTAANILFQAARCTIAAAAATPADDPWYAEVVAYQVLETVTNPTAASGVDAAYDTRRWRGWYWRKDAPIESKRFVADVSTPTIPIDWEVQQGTRAMLAQLLASTGSGWARKLLAKPKKAGASVGDTRVAAVESVLGSDWGKIDSRYEKMLKTVRPAWLVLQPELVMRKNRWLLVGAGNHAATASLAELHPPRGDYAIRGKFAMEGLGTAQLRVQLDWDGKSLVGVSFLPNKVVLAIADEKGKPNDIATFEVDLQLGRTFEVSLEVVGPISASSSTARS
jgi:hypothetical protein